MKTIQEMPSRVRSQRKAGAFNNKTFRKYAYEQLKNRVSLKILLSIYRNFAR